MKRADDKMSFYKWLNSIIPAKLKFCLLAMEIIVHNLNESFLPAIACTRRLLTPIEYDAYVTSSVITAPS